MKKVIDSVDTLVALAEEGRLATSVLADSLVPDARRMFLDGCAAIQKRLTEECTGKGDPCLESGCALEGEVCLNAMLNTESNYHKACAAEWLSFFSDPTNRSEKWSI